MSISAAAARPGDQVIVSGPIGDHGTAVMLARGTLGITADIVSDTAPLNGLVERSCSKQPARRCTSCGMPPGAVSPPCSTKWRQPAAVAVVLEETAVPVRAEVAGVCELLGLDPSTWPVRGAWS